MWVVCYEIENEVAKLSGRYGLEEAWGIADEATQLSGIIHWAEPESEVSGAE